MERIESPETALALGNQYLTKHYKSNRLAHTPDHSYILNGGSLTQGMK